VTPGAPLPADAFVARLREEGARRYHAAARKVVATVPCGDGPWGVAMRR
jgi:hypothetical protein